MSLDWVTLGTIAFVSLLLAIFLGRMYRPKAGGFSAEDTREVLAIVIVVAILIMVATGRDVPDFLVAAFGAVVSSIILKPSNMAAFLRPDLPAAPDATEKRITTTDAGFCRPQQLVLMLAVALIGLGAMLGLSACSTVMAPAIGAAQSFNDKLAEKYGKTNELAEAREKLAQAEADRAGLTLLSRNATVFADEIREQRTDRILTNGVYRRRVYEEREMIAQPAQPLAPPPPVQVEAPATNQVVTTPAHTNATTGTVQSIDANQAGNVVTASATIESRVYEVTASVTDSTGALSLSGASLVCEITVAGPLGWADGIGAVEVAGRVLSISNSPLPLDTSSLCFDGFAGTVSGGVLSVTSQGGDVRFAGTAVLESGAVSGSASAAPGSAAIAFFKTASIVGTGRMLERVVQVATSPVQVVTNTAQTGPVDAIPVDGFVALGTHAKHNPNRMTITRTMRSARIEGGNVRLAFDPLNFSTKSDGEKTVDGRVYIAWQDGDHWTGGHFDWHGLHQTVKTLGNIPGGYLDHKQPPHGAPVAFAISDLEGKQRTQFVISENRWP